MSSIRKDAVCHSEHVRWKTELASMSRSESKMLSRWRLWPGARRAHSFLLFVLFVVFALPSYGQQKPTDYQVEAIYLYNFGKFVQWPANATEKNSEFAVCVLGQDPFGGALDAALAGATISGKHVIAKRISSAGESADCRILFLGSTEQGRLGKIIEAVEKQAVLTVSDIPEFSRRGGMIEFVMQESRVRFEVNLDAAQQAGLTLSSELLKVATTVRGSAAKKD